MCQTKPRQSPIQSHTQAIKVEYALMREIASRTIIRLLDFGKCKSLSSLGGFSSVHPEVKKKKKKVEKQKQTNKKTQTGQCGSGGKGISLITQEPQQRQWDN